MTNEFIQYKCINPLCKMTKNIFDFPLDIFNISAIIINVKSNTPNLKNKEKKNYVHF